MLDWCNPSMRRLLAYSLAAAMILVCAQAAQAQGQPPAAPPAPIAGPAGLMTACPAMPVGLTAADLSGPAVLAPDGTREASPLVLGDDIALGLRHCAPDSRGLHDGWNYGVFVTNLAWDAAGSLSPIARSGSGGRELLLQRDSPLVLFNLVAVVEWDATTEYLNDVAVAFRYASDYLFDLTDGQMAIGQVTIVDNARERGNPASDSDAWWKSADIRISPDNMIHPKHIPASASATRHGIDLGPFWSHTGVVGNWSEPDGHRTLIHELGHHALGLYDEYGKNEFCTHKGSTPPDSAGDVTRASAMSWQFDATEFSACPPQQPNCTAAAWNPLWPLWSKECARTTHYRKTRQSTWAVIDQRYSDHGANPRWQIVSPTERGRVLAGPTAVPAAFPWPQIYVHSYIDPICQHDEPVCQPVREVCVDDMQLTCGGKPSYVSLQRQGATDQIDLGQLDAAGCIQILEAKPGSTLMISCFNDGNYVATMVIEQSMPASVSTTYPETPLALPGAPSAAFAGALLSQDAAVLDWTARYWENVQIVAQNYPDLALQLFVPPLELPADSESLISLLEQQASLQADWQGVAGPHLPVAGDVAFDTNWPAAGSLWWQQNPLLEDAANAQQRSLQQALSLLVAQAYRRQTNIAAQTIDADSGGFLITPDGVWTAEAPSQPAPVDVALESISAVPGQQAAGDIATGFSLTASGSLVGPIMVRYTTNCGPDGGATDLALVNIQTNAQINPTFIESCFPVEFAIDEAGTYRLISTAQ